MEKGNRLFEGNSLVHFTLRERTIMRQMFSGHNIAQISEELEISVGTVNLRIRAICSKVAPQNRYQLIVYIFQYPRCLLEGSECPCGMHRVTDTCPCWYCQDGPLAA
jgi:DNA-binding CsgD family transcriptional regulator